MYLADYHTHSATSPDGQLTVSELAEAAEHAQQMQAAVRGVNADIYQGVDLSNFCGLSKVANGFCCVCVLCKGT